MTPTPPHHYAVDLLTLCLVLCLALCWPGVAVAAGPYYVNPDTGLDSNTGSITSAWKSMLKARSSVQPGETIYIQAGTYFPSQYKGEDVSPPYWTSTQSLGTAEQPITVQAEPGATVIFDGQGEVGWMYFYANSSYNGHYVVIKDLTFRNFRGAAISIGSIPSAHHVAVVGCTFRNFGMQESGALGAGGADHVIFKGNTFFNIGDPTLPGDAIPNGEHAIYISENTQNLVLDQNVIEKSSGYDIVFYGHSDFATTVAQSIVRRNTAINAHASGVGFSGTNFSHTYVYHNTFYQEAVPFAAIDGDAAGAMINFHGGGDYVETTVKNNLSSGYVLTAPFWTDAYSDFHGSLHSNYNLLRNLLNVGRAYNQDNTNYTLAAYTAATGLGAQSVEGDPRFTNAASRVFTLEPGSAAIDAGTTLTTTATSGSGTTVRLTDAGYFHDGYGMIDGDTIQIGSTIVTITAINYATNDIVVQPGLTWTAGQSVSFPYTGVAPDMGAFESGSIIEEPPGGLQAYWRLDTGTGTSLVDATGNGHTGVLTDAAAWSPGHVGPRAVTFDGLGMKGTVTPAFAYTQYTWIMWIQGATAPSAAVNTQALVNGSDPDNWGFNWSNTTTSFMQAAYQQDASGAYVAAQLTTPLLAHVWYFVVATFDGSLLRVYLNGQLQASTAVSSVATGGGDFGLGNNPNRARWFAGSLDNVQVYNTAVSAAQILALYRTQAGAPRHRLLMR